MGEKNAVPKWVMDRFRSDPTIAASLYLACKSALRELVTVAALTGSSEVAEPTCGMIRRAIARAERHVHEAPNDGTDNCKLCGDDLFSWVHLRSGEVDP